MNFNPIFMTATLAVLVGLLASGEAFYRPATGMRELSGNKDFMEALKWLFNLSDDEPEEIPEEQKKPECKEKPFSIQWMNAKCWEEQGIDYLPENRRYTYTLLGKKK